MTKKALILVAGIALVLAAIFAAGCTDNQASEGTVVQAPALGGYDVALAIGDAPDNNKLVTEKAVYDALAELRKQINENANSGSIMVMGSGGGGSSTVVNNNAVWGKVTGNLDDQTDLKDELANMLDLRDFSTVTAQNFLVVNPSSANAVFGVVDSIPADMVKPVEDKKMDPAALPVANASSAGIVKADGTSITIDADGTIHASESVPTWAAVIGKPFSSIGFGLLNTSDTLSVDTSKIATQDNLTKYDTHVANDALHVTVANKSAWDAKIGKTDIVDDLNSDDATKVLSAKQGKALNTTLGTKVDKVAGSSLVENTKISGYDTHLGNNDIHVTAANKTAWDAKQDKLTAGTGITIQDNTISASTPAPSWTDVTDKPFSTVGSGLTNTSGVLAVDMTDIANKTELGTKVDKVAGSSLVENTKISGYDTHLGNNDIHVTAANKTAWDAKQEKLTAGEGITISGTTISATSSTPSWSDITDKPFSTVGSGLTNTSGVLAIDMTDIANKTELGTKVDKVAGSSLVENTKISGYDAHLTDTTSHVTATNKTAWDGKQDKLTAGTGITIEGNTISASGSAPAWGTITGTLSEQTDLQTALNAKVNKSDIVDNLNSDATTKVLSAKQGKALNTSLAKKVDKVSGKGLSTNDYTTAEKTKLSGIATGAEVNVQANWTQTSTSADDYIKNKPHLYQHNIVVCDGSFDSPSGILEFSFITTDKDAYGSNVAVSKALYKYGYTGPSTMLSACGWTSNGAALYIGAYGDKNGGRFHYAKVTINSDFTWNNGNWDSFAESVRQLL